MKSCSYLRFFQEQLRKSYLNHSFAILTIIIEIKPNARKVLYDRDLRQTQMRSNVNNLIRSVVIWVANQCESARNNKLRGITHVHGISIPHKKHITILQVQTLTICPS